MRRPADFDGWPVDLQVTFGPYRGIVKHIVDGDTLDVLLDLGFNNYEYRTMRLAGINAPESNRPASRDAGLAAKSYLSQLLPLQAFVMVKCEPDTDSFGRYIATITDTSGRVVNDLMVEAGHAVYQTY